MRKLLIVIILVACSATAWATTFPLNAAFNNVSSLTFTCASSAMTSSANLRILGQTNKLLKTPNGQEVQGLAGNSITNFFLTKSLHVSVKSVFFYMIDVDQNTKVYPNGGSNFWLISSGTPFSNGVFK